MSISAFFDHNPSCAGLRDWAHENCQTMLDVWTAAPPEWMPWLAQCPGVLTDREQSAYGTFVCQQTAAAINTWRARQAELMIERAETIQIMADEAIAAQAAWLRSNTAPRFEPQTQEHQ